MRARSWYPWLAAALLGAVLALILRPTGAAPAGSLGRVPHGPVQAGTVTDPPIPWVAFDEQRRSVESACDLPLDAGCGEAFCAALTVMPDLDQLGGWLQVSLTHPRLVWSTVVRDLGVPAGGLPCGSAVDSLAAEHGIAAVELRDGTEVWCAVSGDEAAGFAWCGARATERLSVPVAFDAGARRLAFDRSAP